MNIKKYSKEDVKAKLNEFGITDIDFNRVVIDVFYPFYSQTGPEKQYERCISYIMDENFDVSRIGKDEGNVLLKFVLGERENQKQYPVGCKYGESIKQLLPFE